MGAPSSRGGPAIQHSRAFRARRALNWFPMGLTYAFLYFGRYNLTVSKNALGDLMTKEEFGHIFGVGALVYGFAFLLNGPLTDRIGGRRALLLAAFGAGVANLLMGLYLQRVLLSPDPQAAPLELVFTALYALNMYFQSFGAVAIVKVNAHWFHVTERGGFSGIFGTMISSGIFFAFTVNGWILDAVAGSGPGGITATWWVFDAPAMALIAMGLVEVFLLRDRPGLAGHEDFDTGDASSGESSDPLPLGEMLRRILTNPIILTVGLIEFCTGVLRNGVMHWFPIYTKEVWALPSAHPLRNGSWEDLGLVLTLFAVAAALFVLAWRTRGRRRAVAVISGAAVALAPFVVSGGWGGILFAAGVVGGNVAGWVSDLFFQSRRAPTAGGLYALLAVCVVAMWFALGGTTTRVDWVKGDQLPLRVGDRIVAVEGSGELSRWEDVARAVACVPPTCEGGAGWDAKACVCRTGAASAATPDDGTLTLTVERDGKRETLSFPDPAATQRAGDKRVLAAGPELTLSPFVLGVLVFLISLAVIGTHGLLSGTATMDFGGRRAAATAVGFIDGLVYLGTGLQSFALGSITQNVGWAWWPVFLLPFGVAGFLLCLRIWNAKPKAAGGGGH